MDFVTAATFPVVHQICINRRAHYTQYHLTVEIFFKPNNESLLLWYRIDITLPK